MAFNFRRHYLDFFSRRWFGCPKTWNSRCLSCLPLRAREDRIQLRRELNGLLRVLDVEIELHEWRLSEWEKRRDELNISVPLATEAWHEVRARLSQLLRNETEFADFARYYHNLEWMDSKRLDPTIHPLTRANMLRDFLPQLREEHELVKRHVREYIPQSTRGRGSKITSTLPEKKKYPPPSRETGRLEGALETVPEDELPGVLRVKLTAC